MAAGPLTSASTSEATTSRLSSQQPRAVSRAPTVTADWTRDLVRLAKTAELRIYGNHTLSLQLHTAQILSAQASLDQRKLAIEDLREQKNKLDSERARLLDALRKVNEDRDQAEMLTATLHRDCAELSAKIQTVTDGDYTRTKLEVDKFRQQLGQEPLPSLQALIDEKSAQYLTEIRLAGEKRRTEAAPADEEEPARKRRSRQKKPRRVSAAADDNEDE